VGHLIEREGKTIKRWPIVEFSLTPTPAEPRTIGVERLKALALEHPELKALLPKEPGEGSVDAAKDVPAISPHPTIQKTSETIKMTDITLTHEEYVNLVNKAAKTPEALPPAPPEDPALKALSARMDDLVAKIEKSPALKDAGYVAPDSETDHPDTKSFADFLIAVKNDNYRRIKNVYKTDKDPDEKGTKTALAEDAGATGGYLVPIQYVPAILAAAAPYDILRKAGATVIPMSGKTLQVPALDVETAPSAGDTAFAGGVIAYWTEEAALKTESEPRFRLIELTAHKLAGYSLASDEVAADSGVEAILTAMFGRAIGSKENYAFLRGDGVGKPYGILTSGAVISSTRHGELQVGLADLAQMMSDFLPSSWGKGCWIMNPTVFDQLIQLVSSPLSWMPNLNSANITQLQLLGLPIYVTGALPGVGAVGDILLVDPSYYLIGDRQSISIQYSEHYRFIYDQGTWRFTARVDGQPWLQTYITLEDAATTVSPFVSLSTATA